MNLTIVKLVAGRILAGLGSLLARFDAMGGSMDIASQAGGGTRVTVTSPPEPATASSARQHRTGTR